MLIFGFCMRSFLQFRVSDPVILAENLAHFISQQEYGILLRGCDVTPIPGTTFAGNFDLAVGLGIISALEPEKDYFSSLLGFLEETNDWVFGYFTYDVKNELENLHSSRFDGLKFPEMFFSQPEMVLLLRKKNLIAYFFPEITPEVKVRELVEVILHHQPEFESALPRITFKPRYTKSEYQNTVMHIKDHIMRGDIYEMNFCQEFYNDSSDINPASAFNRLYRVSPTPFGAFLKVGSRYLMSASPERYIRKDGDLITSQPIKGTAPRKKDLVEDEEAKNHLAHDPKERAENVMIVDLVRNDLSKVAVPGSVNVSELCGIYSFEHVHQMISTVTCKIRPAVSVIDPIKATFPMGSMTGAPKIRAMQLIEEFERSRRGLFSGTVGYFTPDGDFDFNVVIRSLLYNEKNSYLSFTVGGAITFNSEPEKEYDECLLKAEAILTALGATIENAG